jgi:hypothetical protein
MAAEGLVHLTGAGNAIAESGVLIGRQGIYATSLETASKTGLDLTLRTGVSESSATAAVRIPAAAQGAFTSPTPIGPITAWQRAFGTQYTAAGTIDLATGAFTRSGVNWNQAFLYSVDAAFTGTAVGVGVSVALDH